ncbi:DNA replication regulator SLD3-domain-containing protein [Diplogelasinospora grovesii]|uniref:DNA replication regulator SLD3-domain-containing protein n=1 Tax=Diplogelasinospora grovesii TaxID=303347 RepID=A0AAN6NGY7_9PEZI|nr:DNA replication regulator SLD3-domain-containing protein [Diplogelasinospora grovesii]
MSSTIRPGSSSRSATGILAPICPATLNQKGRHVDLSSDAKKRKRDAHSLPTDDLLKPAIVLKPHPSSLVVKPSLLHPLMLLPRENLPLSTLDLAQPHGDLPASRSYESKIKILDLEGRLGSNVLIARSETSRMVFAIEREDNGLYCLCKLGGWVDVEKLSQSATVVCSQRLKSCRPAAPSSAVVQALITPQMYKENKRRKLAIEEIQSMVRKRSVSVVGKEPPSQSSTPVETNAEDADAEVVDSPAEADNRGMVPVEKPTAKPEAREVVAVPQPEPSNDGLSQPSAEDIFQNIRTHYLETLYHSMGSLAYFAKGPLSRARAAFHLDCESNLDMNDLIDFLKSLVMTTILIDKKYRETIPDIISTMKMHVDDSENGESKVKKRKPKKPKMGKDGLYASEDEHVRKWWAAQKPSGLGDDQKMVDLETRYHISCLRQRETQLQMILILEILALEPLRRPTEIAEDSQLPGMESQSVLKEACQETAKKRSKHNLPVLLDVHVDRLCIWQTTASDEVKSLAESQVPQAGTAKPERASSDPLRDFCIDIIVPFFSARLPELCDSINRKLGGPVVQPPPKERHTKPAVPAPKPRPGAPMKRTSSIKKDSERTLERVLSNERMRRSVSRGPSGALALLRSASVTAIPGLKREGSEPLLAMIPKAADATSLKDKAVSVFSRSTSTSSMQDLRAQRKAKVEAELKDAISALKKPNRALVGKEVVEEAEKRIFSGVPQPKSKLKKPSRASAAQQVVKATPANNRFKDVIAAESQQAYNSQFGSRELVSDDYLVPPSSAVVPSSGSASRRTSNMFSRSPAAAAVQATPARPSSVPAFVFQGGQNDPQQDGNDDDDEGGIPLSPVLTRKAAVAAVAAPAPPPPPPPPRPTFASGSNKNTAPAAAASIVESSSPGLVNLFETPLKPRSAMIIDKGNKGKGSNLFAALSENTPTTPGRPLPETPKSSRSISIGKKGVESGTIAASPSPSAGRTTQKKKDMTIYQRLGWDDELDDLA